MRALGLYFDFKKGKVLKGRIRARGALYEAMRPLGLHFDFKKGKVIKELIRAQRAK